MKLQIVSSPLKYYLCDKHYQGYRELRLKRKTLIIFTCIF